MPKCIIVMFINFGAMRQVGFHLVLSALSVFLSAYMSTSHSVLIVHTSHLKCQEYCDGSWMSQ